MAALRVRRTWWIVQQQDAPLFRVLARRWRPVDRRERRITPFQLALSPPDAPPPSHASFGPKRVAAGVATKIKKAGRSWNPWMMMK